MLYTMTTPRVREKLLHEIDSAVQRGELSNPITSAEGEKLPYLQVGLPFLSSKQPSPGINITAGRHL